MAEDLTDGCSPPFCPLPHFLSFSILQTLVLRVLVICLASLVHLSHEGCGHLMPLRSSVTLTRVLLVS